MFEKSLVEAAAGKLPQEGDDGRAGAPRTPSRPSQNDDLANTTDVQGNEHAESGSGNGGQFVSKGEGGVGAAAKIFVNCKSKCP